MTLGQRISTYRKQLGISQEALGERLGVSRQAVSKWETDTAAPDMTNLIALAREFGVSVAELTQTPEPRDVPTVDVPPSRRGRWAALGVLAAAILVLLGVGGYWRAHGDDGQVSKVPQPVQNLSEPSHTEQTIPTRYPASDFALLWTSADGDEEFLELGEQEDFFPFGTSLELTAPEEVLDTDYHLTELHKTVCGAVNLDYLHIGEDLKLDPDSPERESVICLSTMSRSVHTPRDIRVGSTKAEVTAAYGDELVYCLKEEGGYTLVQHDYYYAYQTQETFGASLQIFMRDGLVAGLRVESMGDEGNEAFRPNNVFRFPMVNGEPDFSQRQEPEREERGETWQVYHAWNELVTNNNLSAEEIYTYRWTIFSGLSDLDWQELSQWGTTEYPGQTIEALMSWLQEQAPYSEAETFRLQMGCAAKGLDGVYTDMYCHLLSTAFFGNPIVFANGLACDSVEDTMYAAIRFTAYDAELYPVELRNALDILEAAIESGGFTEAEAGWAKLLRLYLVTPINNRNELPRTPAELQ